jgi:aspartyl-tRNA(Asn)/glutamyl-tRNA(Gln) amidotransferase subunit A
MIFHAIADLTEDAEAPRARRHALEGLRIGVPQDALTAATPAIRDAIEEELEVMIRAGAVRRDITLPDSEAAHAAWLTMVLAESAAYHRLHLETAPEAIGDDVRPFLMAGLLLPARRYIAAARVRRAWCSAVKTALAGIDLLATPALPNIAPPCGAETMETGLGIRPVRDAMVHLQWPANFLGWPSLAVPCTRTVADMPVGLMLTGEAGSDEHLLAVGEHLEEARQ